MCSMDRDCEDYILNVLTLRKLSFLFVRRQRQI